jgi:hypothetical protein
VEGDVRPLSPDPLSLIGWSILVIVGLRFCIDHIWA